VSRALGVWMVLQENFAKNGGRFLVIRNKNAASWRVTQELWTEGGCFSTRPPARCSTLDVSDAVLRG
jgi:hypothetical protein